MTTANLKLATWTHPRTGETRVYVNGHDVRGVKIFFTEAFGGRIMGKHSGQVFGPRMMQEIEQVQCEVDMMCDGKFAKLIEMAD